MMKHSTRFLLLVFAAALLFGLAGCGSTHYPKGGRQYKPDDAVAALRELKPLAEQGNAQAQFSLGSLYYQGWGVPQDYREAVGWLRKAAEQGHRFSQSMLGTLFAEGVQGVVEKDQPQALMWFIFAAAGGDVEALEFRDSLASRMTPAQIAEAQSLAREFKPQDAYAKLLRDDGRLAEQGDAAAQFRVGLIYYKGRGVRPDYREALRWFKKASLQGHLLAQYNVGYMNEKGEGTPQDHLEAAKHYRLAAERGNQLAQFNLGSMYERGQGVMPDEVQALMWYNLAAIQGETRARAARDRITIWMTPAQIAESQRLARQFKPAEK
jgi:TPR repeat protein